jgi:murein L,D-transpeptidase YcbB/YkuD
MAYGPELVALAAKHVSEKYVLGSSVPKDNASWKGPWDCAEFVSWCVYQLTGKLYGCNKNNGAPSIADAYTGYWKRDSSKLLQRVSLDEAAVTAGAIVLRSPATSQMGHIVISDGRGGTVEAASSKLGVKQLKLAGRRWDLGLLIPEISYSTMPSEIPVIRQPNAVLRLTKPNMSGAIVQQVQRALKAQGYMPGVIDGQYGPHTAQAVRAFQAAVGLVADGEVGAKTFKALKID